MLTIAADPKHFGIRIGITSVLHTWGSFGGGSTFSQSGELDEPP